MTFRLFAIGACIAGLSLMGALTQTQAEGYKPSESYHDGDDRLHNEVRPKAYRHGRSRDGYRYIYVESERGFNRIVAPVRRTPVGNQVRLPGGAWIDCEYSCEYTLRKESLDFWDKQNVSPRVLYWEFGVGRF